MANSPGGESLHLQKLQLGPYGTNCYILADRHAREAIIVDAPAEPDRIVEAARGYQAKYLVITHTHRDHLGAFEALVDALKLPVAINAAEAGNLPRKPDVILQGGEILHFGKLAVSVLHTPGHTPGGTCLLVDKHLIAGDTIFAAGPGKTGSPAALKQIIDSITRKIFTLPDDTIIYPGHGNNTVVAREKKEYEVFASRGHDPRLCGDVVWLVS